MEKELVNLFRDLALKQRSVIQDYLRNFDIYLGQHRILFRLEENPNISLTELRDQLNVSKESLFMSIKRMEQAGFIKRKRDPQDKRRVLLSLTDVGLETSKSCREGFNKINNSMFKNLEQEEIDSLKILFVKMIEGLEGAKDETNL